MAVKIVALGACVADTLMTVPHYPAEDTKLRAEFARAAGGGPAATGLVAAAKLGADTAFLGVLADDAGGRFLMRDFEKYGVSTETVRVRTGYRSFTSVIWLSRKTTTRTCVFDKGDLPPLTLDEAQKAAIRAADVLMVDGNELEAAVEAATVARANGTTVLYDCGGLYAGVERLLPLCDLLIPSREFALGHTGAADAPAAAKILMERYHPAAVVVTCGKTGGVGLDAAGAWEYPALPAEVVDSNGAGDVFHGAFAFAAANGYDHRDCCIFASAVSALKCTGVGARESAPDLAAVKKYLKENGYDL